MMTGIIKEVLLLFVPGAVGALLYRFLGKKQWDVWSYIENYAVFAFMSYFLTRTVFYLSGLQEFSINEIGLVLQLKFGIVSIILSVAAACGLHFGEAVGKIAVGSSR